MLLTILIAPATMQPRTNDTTWVTAETCGSRAMSMVIAKNAITAGSLQYLLFNDGVLIPINAKIMLENPTTSADVQNHEIEAMIYAQIRSVKL